MEVSLQFSRWCLAISLVCQLLVSSVEAESRRFYKYKNEQGQTVINSSIPPKYAKKGYTVIDTRGRVIQVVAPELTQEQILEKKQRELLEQAKREQEEQQKQADQTLLRLYSSVEDVERAMERQLNEISGRISVIQGNIQRLQKQKADKQARAANIERAGRTVPKRLLDSIKEQEQEITGLLKQVEDKQKEQVHAKAKFAKDANRLKVLLGLEQSNGSKTDNGVKVAKQDLLGNWKSTQTTEDKHEWVLNPKGTFTWMRKTLTGERVVLDGKWKLRNQNQLIFNVKLEQNTDNSGTTTTSKQSKTLYIGLTSYKNNKITIQYSNQQITLQKQ
ncbi:hypothetical protein [Spartinivicinus poritis]|uniref:Uncharacterized protein n=1 Tax=Spartinivicinus poritis TaxID=2994640 RepID=A0ABT5UEQ9_9GAMM|nr:hypothetical protein [Spartinivicinus sp. A2-2]MDE1463574.1 hypothetical protein [Spartinivicinus sp. A2-2]